MAQERALYVLSSPRYLLKHISLFSKDFYSFIFVQYELSYNKYLSTYHAGTGATMMNKADLITAVFELMYSREEMNNETNQSKSYMERSLTWSIIVRRCFMNVIKAKE